MKTMFWGLGLTLLVSCADFDQNIGEVLKVAQEHSIPTQGESVSATKQALEKGVGYGINLLQAEGGFSSSVHRIVVPPPLQKASNLARNAGLGSYVDGFEKALNQAAEQAVSSAVPIFKDAISQLTFQDIVKILSGPDNAATSYFQASSEKKLEDTFRPIVAKATAKNKVAQLYSQLVTTVRPVATVAGVPLPSVNIDEYVSNKAVDALFIEIANQEKKIRENPVERTTALLKKVFSFYDGRSNPA